MTVASTSFVVCSRTHSWAVGVEVMYGYLAPHGNHGHRVVFLSNPLSSQYSGSSARWCPGSRARRFAKDLQRVPSRLNAQVPPDDHCHMKRQSLNYVFVLNVVMCSILVWEAGRKVFHCVERNVTWCSCLTANTPHPGNVFDGEFM